MNVSSRRSRWSRAKSLLMKPLNIKRGKTPRCRLAGADHLPAVYGGADDRAADADAGVAGAGDRHRFRLPDGHLAHLVHHVCSVERIKSLQWQARRRLKQLDLHNVSTRHGDGWQGWQARAPFDAIIVTAAPPKYRPRCWRSWMMTACWCCRSASISFSNGSVVGATNLSLIPSRPFALFPGEGELA